MTMVELEVLAPAKVNFFLGVLRKRIDGYHDIVSAMQKVDLTDRLHFRLAGSGLSLRCPSSNLPEDSTNLAWKAARLFFDQTGITDSVRITLHKRIPVAAGLGGGSSDAAAVLRGLDTLFATGLNDETLLALAAQLGADVPFFVVDATTALASGTGIDLQPIAGPKGYWLVLVNPGVAVSTRWVYENLILTTGDNPYKLSGYFHEPEEAAFLLDEAFVQDGIAHSLFFNDLETVTIGRYPVIRAIKEQLVTDGAIAALMSGSGPTVFGVYRQFDLAKISYEKFRELYPEVYLVSPLN
jgi:4-diphosphocytidyl-2-C-methyl-D-erythritol kinase